MDIDWNIVKSCTEEAKREIYGQIKSLIKVASEFMAVGIIAFINEIERETDQFLRAGYKLLVSGMSPENITRIMSNMLKSTKQSSCEYVKRVVFTDYILLVQQGENINNIRLILISYLGTGYAGHIIEPIPSIPPLSSS